MTILLSDLEITCLLAIAVFGVPHGAYDYEFIKTATKERGSNFALMIAAYLTLVILSLVLWFLAPTFSILIFLLISTYHFGAADALNYGIKSEDLNISKSARRLCRVASSLFCYHCFIGQRFRNIFASSKATMEHC